MRRHHYKEDGIFDWSPPNAIPLEDNDKGGDANEPFNTTLKV